MQRATIFLAIILAIGADTAVFAGWKMFLVAGQSNAVGNPRDPSKTGIVTCDPSTAYEFNYTNNQLVPLKDPVGVSELNFDVADNGSAWPAFAKRYHALTNDTLIIVQAARNGTTLYGDWSGVLSTNAITKVKAAIQLTKVTLTGIVWLQGESDGIAINNGTITKTRYAADLANLISKFRIAFAAPNLPFYIIRIGTMTMLNDSGFRQIREAQDEAARQVSRTYVVYRNTVNFPALGLLVDGIHYSQAGLNDVGTVSADSVVLIESGQQTDALIQQQHPWAISSVKQGLLSDPYLKFDLQGRKIFAYKQKIQMPLPVNQR